MKTYTCDICGKEFEKGLISGRANIQCKLSCEKEEVTVEISAFTTLTQPANINRDICLFCLMAALTIDTLWKT